MLRDNLYANRTRVELSGQIKYKRLQNEEISSFKKQQHEILVRRRINDMKETPEERNFRKTQRKTEVARKTMMKKNEMRKTEMRKTEVQRKTEIPENKRPISPLALESKN